MLCVSAHQQDRKKQIRRRCQSNCGDALLVGRLVWYVVCRDGKAPFMVEEREVFKINVRLNGDPSPTPVSVCNKTSAH